MKGKEKICVGIIHEVYLQKEDVECVKLVLLCKDDDTKARNK